MHGFMNNYNADIMETSSKKYDELENKFKRVISRCNRRNLISVDDSRLVGARYGVTNATSVEHYRINELHIYRFCDKSSPICYWISNNPVMEKYRFTNSSGNQVGERFTGNSCFEYSCGGVGNSLPVDRVNKYSMCGFIGFAISDGVGSRLETDLISVKGSPLTQYGFSKFGSYKYISEFTTNPSIKRNYENYSNGNLYSFIMELIAEGPDRSQIKDLQDTLSRIDDVILDKKNDQTMRGLLSKILGKDEVAKIK